MLSQRRLDILDLINRLSRESKYNFVRLNDILAHKWDVTPAAIRSCMTLMKQANLLNNPIEGGWALTSLGEETLDRFTKP